MKTKESSDGRSLVKRSTYWVSLGGMIKLLGFLRLADGWWEIPLIDINDFQTRPLIMTHDALFTADTFEYVEYRV